MSPIKFAHSRSGSLTAARGYSVMKTLPAIFAVSETASIKNENWVVHTDFDGLELLRSNAQVATEELSMLIGTLSRLALSCGDPDTAENWPDLQRDAISGIESLRELQHELLEIVCLLRQAEPTLGGGVANAAA